MKHLKETKLFGEIIRFKLVGLGFYLLFCKIASILKLKKVSRLLLPILLLLAFQNALGQQSSSVTYTSGDIPTSRLSVTDCASYSYLQLFIPAGATVTSTNVSYNMTSLNGSTKAQQYSYIYHQETNTSEPFYALGQGITGGTQNYNRTINIANGVSSTGVLTFLIVPRRNSNIGGCDTTYTKVDNNTWKITVNYIEAFDQCDAPNSGNVDTDGDNISDICDEDDDNDGISDEEERNQVDCTTKVSPSFGVINGPFSYNGSNVATPTVGDQFIYNDVYTGVDAIVTIVSSTDTSIVMLDVPGTTAGVDNNFQPQIQHASPTSFTEFKIDFVVADTNIPAPETTYIVTTIDNDLNEFVTYKDGYSDNLQTDTPNKLNTYTGQPANVGGFSKGYISDGTLGADIAADKPEYQITSIYALSSSVSIRFGDARSNTSYHSVSMSPCLPTINWSTTPLFYENIDTDRDGIPNHLDSDSDNDGCSDTDEAYYVAGANPDADADNNGYYGSGTPAVNPTTGRVTAASYSTPNAYYLNNVVNTCDDNDNDGVPDGADEDDDNDGILDTDECMGIVYSVPVVTQNFEAAGFVTDAGVDDAACAITGCNVPKGGGITLLDPSTITCWQPTTGVVEATKGLHPVPSGKAAVFNAFAANTNTNVCRELGIDYNGNGRFGEIISIDNVTVVAGVAYSVAVYAAEVTNTNPYVSSYSFEFYNAGTSTPAGIPNFSLNNITQGNQNWQLNETDFVASVTKNIDIVLVQTSPEELGADIALDAFSILRGTCSGDTDKDGVLNIYDLDSDNDGIPDVIEAGGTDANNDGRADDDDNNADNTGSNGIPTSASTGLTPTSTDGDSIPDYLDLDADNDGIPDVTEAGGIDLNNDGRADDDDNNADNTGSNGIPTSAGTGLTPTSTDGDSVPDYLDLDADNDGIPDNIEGQTTTGYVAPSGADTDNDGFDDAYDPDCTGANCSGVSGAIINPINSDNTDTADYIDLDSDNDGIFDVIESGSGLANDGNGVVTGAVGTNGLVDAIETGDSDQGYTDVNGEYDNTQADNFTDTDKDVNTGGDVDYRDAQENDNDKDGVPDSVDLDDDNDGILDTDEGFSCPSTSYIDLGQAFTNTSTNTNGGNASGNVANIYSFGGTSATFSYELINAAQWVAGVSSKGPTVGVDGNYINTQPNFTNFPSGSFYPANAATISAAVYKITFTQPVFNVEFKWGGSDHSDRTDFLANLNGSNTPLTISNSTLASGSYKITGQSLVSNAIGANAPSNGVLISSQGPLNEIIIVVGKENGDNSNATTQLFELKYCAALDTDNDGIPNHLDLDSDNDGIPDVTEAGGTDSNNDGRADDDDNNVNNTGSNGIPTSANTGLMPTSSDGDGILDYLDLDADNDGIPDNIEAQTTLGYVAPTGVDTDKDGLDDAYDPDCTGANCSGVTGTLIVPVNTDGADTADYLDLDADNDGIFDIIESGSGLANDGSGVVTGAVGTNGLVDAIETSDTDLGYTDVNGEYDNTQADNFTDTDGDVSTGGDVDYRDVQDNDKDGIPDSVDLDDDNDGIPDTAENGVNFADGDADGDGIPNYKDTADTAGGTGDGSTTDYTDSNNDGIPDVYDADGDGIPNHLDLDTDNDGIPDIVEAGGVDTNGDGVIDYPTPGDPTTMVDLDGDGLANTYDDTDTAGSSTGWSAGTPISNPDSDGDGISDAQDLDSDNDGIPDVVEAGGTDANGDGRADNFVDIDNDGFNDLVDGDINGTTVPTKALIITGTDGNSDGIPDNYPNGDTDGDGLLDSTDLDADNDGIPDLVEAGGIDTNGDGRVDTNTDADKDGLADIYDENATDGPGPDGTNGTALVETDAAGNKLDGAGNSIDSDSDGIADHLDLDADNDGIPDLVEAGGIDTNGDGRVDTNTDADKDGLADIYDENATDGPGPDGTNGTALVETDAAGNMLDGAGNSIDTDGDGIADHLDLDADNDGIPDLIEAGGVDNNGDGRVDANTDADEDGFADVFDTDTTDGPGPDGTTNGNALVKTDGTGQMIGGNSNTVDTDGDGIPNHLDLDSDNDGIVDLIEAGGTDTNKDGKVDTITDADNDGFADAVDGSIGTPLITTDADTNSDGIADSYTKGNADTDNFPNFLDIDADNDGIPDNIEGQTTSGYITPSGVGTAMADTNNNGVDDNYETSGIGFVPENTDGTDLPDYLDADSDNDGVLDIAENGDPQNVASGNDADKDGLDDAFDDNDDSSTNGSTVNDGLGNGDKVTNTGILDTSLEDAFGDEDNDFPGTGDLDYRDVPSPANAMITQVYQFGADTDVVKERWIEITNIGITDIPANTIKVQLYKDKSGDQTGIAPDVSYTVGTILEAGNSVLFKNSSNSIILNSEIAADATTVINDALTDINGGDDIITLSTAEGSFSWENRYDIVSSVANNTSVVRIDETLTPNKNYDAIEWVVFIDDAIAPYQSGYGGDDTATKRHPQDPLISEIKNSDKQANTLLGLHRINKTIRENDDWNNGFPDRSRYVVIDQYYNHTGSRLSARKLEVNSGKELRVTDNLLVVTNSIVLDGNIRLSGATTQLVQTHANSSTVTGTGQLFIDQESRVPNLYRYNYMSSPVTNTPTATAPITYKDYFTLKEVLKDGTTPNDPKDITFVTGYDGSYASGILKLADYWVYTYAPGSNGRSNWVHKYRSGAIKKGDGFIFKGPGKIQNYTFVGTPNDGSFTSENEIDTGESYLIGNPFPSAINARKFIDDNIDATTGTLYFWQHVGENNGQGTAGHNFAGYIGGYASQNKITSTNAYASNPTGAVQYTLQAEDAEYTGEPTPLEPNSGVSLNQTDYIKFSNISSGVDVLKITYASLADKNLKITVNNESRGEITFTGTSNNYIEKTINLCVQSGSTIILTSTDDGNSIKIDQVVFEDEDGYIACSGVGNDASKYDDPQPYIAVGQGFFVIGGDTKDKIVFNNSQRAYVTEESGESVLFKSEKKTLKKSTVNELPILKLGMNYANTIGNNFHRQIAISFDKANSFAYENGFDSQMYDVNATDFYWKFPNDDNNYVIAGVQEISDNLEVPLEVVVNKNSVITIVADDIKNISRNIYIKDKITGKTQQINNASASYQLQTGTYTDRFVLAFVPADTSLNIEDELLAQKTSIFADNDNQAIIIIKNKEVNINKVTLFDILGKEISLWDIKEQKETYQLNIKKQIPTGIYIVKMKTDKGTVNKKIMVEY